MHYSTKWSSGRTSAAVATVMAAALALSACTGPADAGPEDEEEVGVETIEITDELIAAAQEEGTLVVRYSAPVSFEETLMEHFTEKFGIEVQLDRKSGIAGTDQFLTEERAGQHVIDVIEASAFAQLPDLAAEGYIVPHKFAPEVQENLGNALLKDNMGYEILVNELRIEYNPDLIPLEVAREKLSTWEGLLDPEFEGEVGIFLPTGASGYAALLTFYRHDQYGPEFLTKLKDHGAKLYTGSAAAREALLAGEISIYMSGTRNQELAQVASGSDIRWINPELIPRLASATISISANAPHPNAARLYAAWVQSEDGQRTIAEMNYVPAQAKYQNSQPILKELAKTDWFKPLPEEAIWYPVSEDLIENYEELRLDMYERLGAQP